MKTLQSIKLGLFTLFLSTAVAYACPESMCQKGNNGGMCAKKDCKQKMQGPMCDTKGCKHKMGADLCATKDCNGPKCQKMDSMKGMNNLNKMCNKAAFNATMMPKAYFLKNLRYTLKNLNLSKSDWADVKLAFASYKTDLKKIDFDTPVKSFQNGKFDRELFLNSHPNVKKMAAQADLIETIYLLLNAEQKKRFPMLMGASQHYFKLHPYRYNQNGKVCN